MTASVNAKKPEPDRVHEVKTRKCMMCGNDHKSTWPGERVCKGCKNLGVWMGGDLG